MDDFLAIDMSKRLKHIQVDKSVNVAEMAGAAGVSKSTMEKWMAGPGSPKVISLMYFCDTFGVEIDWLLYGKGQQYRDVDASGDDRTANNTARQKYRVLSEAEKALCDRIRASGEQMIEAIDAAPQGREAALAKTKVEEAVMWAIKGATK